MHPSMIIGIGRCRSESDPRSSFTYSLEFELRSSPTSPQRYGTEQRRAVELDLESMTKQPNGRDNVPVLSTLDRHSTVFDAGDTQRLRALAMSLFAE